MLSFKNTFPSFFIQLLKLEHFSVYLDTSPVPAQTNSWQAFSESLKSQVQTFFFFFNFFSFSKQISLSDSLTHDFLIKPLSAIVKVAQESSKENSQLSIDAKLQKIEFIVRRDQIKCISEVTETLKTAAKSTKDQWADTALKVLFYSFDLILKENEMLFVCLFIY